MDVDSDQDDDYFQENAVSHGERVNGGSTPEILTRVGLELAFSSEKLLNLEMLLMEVARRATDIEPFILDDESSSSRSVEKAFEFDILYGILDSEVKELDNFISSLQMDIEDLDQKVSQEESADKIKDKLGTDMASLKQMKDVIAEIRKETVKFEKAIDFSHGKAGTSEECGYGNGHISSNTTMQTEDQRRNVLQMLEKSIASELDLEKKLSDSRSTVEELKLKLHHLEQESYFLEDSIETVSERMFAAENASELFWGTLKELMGKINTIQFHLSASMHREQEIRLKLEQSLEKLSAAESTPQKLHENSEKAGSREAEHNHTLSNPEFLALQDKVQKLEGQLKESDSQLQLAKASAEASQEEQNMLHSQLSTLGNIIKNLKDNISRTESRAENAEARCMQLTKANMELSGELSSFRSHGSDKAGFLERKLKESDTQLEHAKASVEAIVEQQNMLKSTMSDMEHMIEDLKGKVLKAETRAEDAESKCTLLTDTNLELSEELSFLRSRVESLENSLRQTNHAKMSTAKDIGIRTKIITNLVAKLALERERLHLQIVTLTKKNKILAQKCKGNVNEGTAFSRKVTANDDELESTKLAQEIFPESSSTETMGKPTAADPVGKEEAETAVPAEDESSAEGTLETVRTIEPTLRNWKYLFVAFLVLLAAVLVYFLYQEDGSTA